MCKIVVLVRSWSCLPGSLALHPFVCWNTFNTIALSTKPPITMLEGFKMSVALSAQHTKGSLFKLFIYLRHGIVSDAHLGAGKPMAEQNHAWAALVR